MKERSCQLANKWTGASAWCRLAVGWGREGSLLRQAGGWVHRWTVKSAWSSQVNGQPGADSLPPQLAGDTPSERRRGLVLPAAARRWGSKGHKLVGAAQGELTHGLQPFCHPTSLRLSSKTCAFKSIRKNRGGGKQKQPSQKSRG